MMAENKRFWTIFFIGVIIVVWMMLAGKAYCQNSTIGRYVLDNGGGNSNSTDYMISYSVGQCLGITTSSNSEYTTLAGFYAGHLTSLTPSPIPTIVSTTVVVPEPATFFLIFTGLIGLIMFMRRKLWVR